MFCPKCGSQNIDEAKFCRGCRADLSNVLAVVEGKPVLTNPVAEKHLELFSSGVRNIILGFGFAALAFIVAMIPGDTHFWVMFLIPTFILLASGISRVIKADGLKKLSSSNAAHSHSLPTKASAPVLTGGRSDYIDPSNPVFETDELLEMPRSVTEGTTRNLKGSDG